jgi:hypothetical protein
MRVSAARERFHAAGGECKAFAEDEYQKIVAALP